MTKQIWKYPVESVCLKGVDMPVLSEFISVQIQGVEAMAWFLVDPACPEMETRYFEIYGTGHDIPMDREYLGTWQAPPFVWHLFENPMNTPPDSLSKSAKETK